MHFEHSIIQNVFWFQVPKKWEVGLYVYDILTHFLGFIEIKLFHLAIETAICFDHPDIAKRLWQRN